MPGSPSLDLNLLPLPVWVLGSFLTFVLAGNALWLARHSAAVRSLPGQWLVQAGRFCFYLGIPYLVMGGWPLEPYRGLLPPQDLGLVGLGGAWTVNRWLEAAATGAGVVLLGLTLLLLAWFNAGRFPLAAHPGSAWQPLVDGLYAQVHWAFYRAALAAIWGNLYLGFLGGLALVMLEWLASLAWHWSWRQPARAGAVWLQAGLALLTALLFLLSHNLWVCLAAHWAVALTFWLLARPRVPAPA